MDDFVGDIDDGDVSGIYCDLVEQRVGVNDHGLSRWQMATICRAIVSPSSYRTDGTVTHIAALTIPHGATVTRIAGRNFDLGVDDAARWRAGRERHEAIVSRLHDALTPVDSALLRHGILNVPADLSVVYAADPLPPASTGDDGSAEEE